MLLVLGLLSGGCAATHAGVQPVKVDSVCRQTDVVLHNARAQVVALRSDVAATRIAAAKQKAELLELRREVAESRRAKAGIHQESATAQADVLVLQRERDRLQQAQVELRGQLAELPRLRQTAAQAQSEKGRALEQVKALEASVAILNSKLDQMKNTVAGLSTSKRTQPVRSADWLNEKDSVQVMTASVKAKRQDRIVVRRGDTLWELARDYGVTVKALKAANGLRGDLIRIGQRLQIPDSNTRPK